MGNADAAPGRSPRQRDGLHRQQAAHGERKDARGRWAGSGDRRARCAGAAGARRHEMKWFVAALLLTASAGLVHAQNPMLLRWDKAAHFPEPEEELYGIESGGKMYVIGGFSENGKPAPAMVYEYDPGPDKWTKKKPIPVPVHHQAQAKLNGKIYIFGGCQRPLTGPRMGGCAPG